MSNTTTRREHNGSGTGPVGPDMSIEAIRDRIKKAQDIRSEIVPIDEWGEDGQPLAIEIRGLTGKERADAQAKFIDADTGAIDFEGMNPVLVIATAFKPGTDLRIFSDGDAGWLGDKAAGPLERLAAVAMRLSGLDQAARERVKKG